MTEVIAIGGGSRVGEGARIDEDIAAGDGDLHRKGIRVRVTAVHRAERAAVDDGVIGVGAPVVAEDGITADRIQAGKMVRPGA